MTKPFDQDADSVLESVGDDSLGTEAIPDLSSSADPSADLGITSSRTVIMPKALPPRQSTPDDDLGHFLVVTSGPDQGLRYKIEDRPLVLGRRDVDIKITDPAVSGRHCRITRSGNQLMIEDLMSSNGTYVDGRKVKGNVLLMIGQALRTGATELRHVVRSEYELKQDADQDRQLERAASYVQSILPPPLDSPDVTIRCRFLPSSQLGGDAFSYQWLDQDHLAIYLIDVCGHGLDSALHSVSVVQLLRTGSLAGADFRQPGEVLEGLNRAFHMEEHGGMYFTAWYGVYLRRERRLRVASAGHPPGLLVSGGRAQKVWTHQPPIGMLKGESFVAEELEVPEASRLFVFSDGAFELELENGDEWTLEGLHEVLSRSDKLPPEAQLDAIESALREVQGKEQFGDDLSILLADFL